MYFAAHDKDSLQKLITEYRPYCSLKYSCFAGVNRHCLSELRENKFLVVGFIADEVAMHKFIEDFNSKFDHWKFTVHHTISGDEALADLLKLGEKNFYTAPTFKGKVSVLLSLTCDLDIPKDQEFAITVPLMQIVRGFGCGYSTYRSFCEDPTVDGVLNSTASFVDTYGIWSSNTCDKDTFKLLDDLDTIRKINFSLLCGKDISYPKGTYLISELKRIRNIIKLVYKKETRKMNKLFSYKDMDFSFAHFVDNVEVSPDINDDRKITSCVINKGSDVLSEGIAIVHPGDNFNRSVGRKIALTRALSKLSLSREDREKIWKAYFSEIGHY
jgi:hypothetical protein